MLARAFVIVEHVKGHSSDGAHITTRECFHAGTGKG
jgi:hypothetical protein